MFGRLTARSERRARDRAAARAQEFAARMAEDAPPGIDIQSGPEGISLSGRGIVRRFALDPALRWLSAEARR